MAPDSPNGGQWFAVEAERGQTIDVVARVANPADVPQTVNLYLADLTFNDDQPAVGEPNAGVGAWGAFERGIWADQASLTPGFLAVTGLDAVSACARSQETEAVTELEDCLRRALSLKILSRWPP